MEVVDGKGIEFDVGVVIQNLGNRDEVVLSVRMLWSSDLSQTTKVFGAAEGPIAIKTGTAVPVVFKEALTGDGLADAGEHRGDDNLIQYGVEFQTMTASAVARRFVYRLGAVQFNDACDCVKWETHRSCQPDLSNC